MGKSGKTLAEYALILFLVALMAIPALQILGGAVNDLLLYGDAPSRAGQLFALLGGGETGGGNGADGGSGTGAAGGAGNPAMATNGQAFRMSADGGGSLPGTAYFNRNGQPIVTVNTADGTGMPATSANGGAMVKTGAVGPYGSFKLAKAMDELAKEADNPIEAAYLEDIARLSYYMGHAEGELDDVPGIDIPPAYSNRDALNDLISLSGDLKKKLDNPPKNAGSELLDVGKAMGAEVYDISQQYTSALNRFIDSDGKVTTYFRNETSCKTDCVNGGQAGLATTETNFVLTPDHADTPSPITENPPEFGEYGGDYNYFREKANKALDSGTINSEPVEVTFTDARITDDASRRARWRERHKTRQQ